MKDPSGHIPVVLDNYSLKEVLPLTDTNAYNISAYYTILLHRCEKSIWVYLKLVSFNI